MNIEDLILKHGPILSSDFISLLAKAAKITPQTAKQRLSRSSSVNKLSLGFINNQAFVYHNNHLSSQVFWERLDKSLKESSKAYYAVLKGLFFHNGYLRKNEIAAYSNSPILLFKSRVQFSEIESNLISSKLIEFFDTETYKVNKGLYNQDNFNRFKAVELVKKRVVEDFALWVAKLNLVSFNTGKFLNQEAQVGGFQWAYTSPSYIQGLNPITDKTKPGFIVADILIGRTVYEEDVEFFLNKISILKSRPKLRRFIPILICDFVEPSCFALLREKGVVIALIREIFGDNYSEAMKLLLETLTDATNIIKADPNKFFELINTISKLKGKFGNIKGDLLELAIGYYYSLKNYPFKIGKIITDKSDGKSKEIDVYINSSAELIFVESKAYDRPMTKSEVNEWLSKIPIIRNWVSVQEDIANKQQSFELWSMYGFEKDALELLESRSKGVNKSKYSIIYLGREEIIKKIKDSKDVKLQETINSYFSKF